LKVDLVDRFGIVVKNTNKIGLNISFFTSESPPQRIQVNTSGNKILKGRSEKDIFLGNVEYDKLQIKEVTSHFRNGWIFMMISAEQPNLGSKKRGSTPDRCDIDFSSIRPLILDRVIVKAKKAKDVTCAIIEQIE